MRLIDADVLEEMILRWLKNAERDGLLKPKDKWVVYGILQMLYCVPEKGDDNA